MCFHRSSSLFPQISGADDLFKKPLAPPKKDEKTKVRVLWVEPGVEPFVIQDSLSS